MKKYNIFSEVKISNIILIILGIGLCIISLAIDEKFHFTYLILTLLLISIFYTNLSAQENEFSFFGKTSDDKYAYFLKKEEGNKKFPSSFSYFDLF